MKFFMGLFLVPLALSFGFFFLSKAQKWESLSSTAFECGFTSYFFTRFSQSIHYFLVALIFLFLDLELCFLVPLIHESGSVIKFFLLLISFSFMLLMGLFLEWSEGKLEWKF